ncbi:hypothetical protein ASE16_02515 [Leifsonia sp. Root227]|uniref:class I mannose-6-phosphate isomerase n=1 Tax=Leifsonia sp. Root227 TaxID=1736496 RepID=UPI0007011924|nr:class I mannose-6-phosphate isomerase [Leifsonia sp. Root227]KRC51959.1 hypothetical protein ASE16_02515 [Leifsonia sp. Root227]
MTTIDTSRGSAYAPLILAPNQPDHRPYRGGAGIARFRGTAQPSPYSPEDFVASTTEIFAGGGIGLTILPDGRSLRDAVIADPIGFLGEDHVRRYGARTMLLVKLLDTAERLFVHYHPDDAFAALHLGSPLGKTEAWVVIDVAEPGSGYAALGFNRNVSNTEVRHWFHGQDAPDMLGAMNHVQLSAGDTLLVPAGLPHAIGPGLTLVELQQPTDLSVLLEYSGYNGLTSDDALLGLDLSTAVEGLNRSAVDHDALSQLMTAGADGNESLFPREADTFFSAERIQVAGRKELDACFSILVVLDGCGAIEYAGGRLPVSRGTTVLSAHGVGELTAHGDFTLLRCRPPRP